MPKYFTAFHAKLAHGASSPGSAVNIEQLVMSAIGMELGC